MIGDDDDDDDDDGGDDKVMLTMMSNPPSAPTSLRKHWWRWGCGWLWMVVLMLKVVTMMGKPPLPPLHYTHLRRPTDGDADVADDADTDDDEDDDDDA